MKKLSAPAIEEKYQIIETSKDLENLKVHKNIHTPQLTSELSPSKFQFIYTFV